MWFALLLQVVSIGQTGGVIAQSIGSVAIGASGQVVQVVSVSQVRKFGGECAVEHGWFVKRRGRYWQSSGFRARSIADQMRLMDTCQRRGR